MAEGKIKSAKTTTKLADSDGTVINPATEDTLAEIKTNTDNLPSETGGNLELTARKTELLEEILMELKIINLHLEALSDEHITLKDVS